MGHRRRTWRDDIRPLVAAAIASGRAAGLEGRQLTAHIRGRRPYWVCAASWMTHVWLSEVRIQLGRHKTVRTVRPRRPDPPGQGTLF